MTTSYPLGEAKIPIRLTLDKFGDDADKARGALGGFVSSVGKVGAIGAGAIAAVGVAGIAGAVGITQFAEGFQDATNALIVGTGASGQSLAEMEEIVKRLKGTSAGLGQEFGNLGAVVAEVNTRTGATGETLEGFSQSILDFSRLTGGDGVKNTQLITRVMGDWGVEMEDSAELLDALFGAGQAFGISTESLSQKVVQFGAPLRQMGFTLEESIALFGKWEKEGVNTELAIGSLRIAAGKFAKEGMGEVTDSLQEFLDTARDNWYLMEVKNGIDRAVESGKSFEEVLQSIDDVSVREDPALKEYYDFALLASEGTVELKDKLEAAMEEIKNAKTETDALAIAMGVFGARAGPDMAAAIREGRFELDGAIEALQGTSGGLEDASNRALKFGERLEIMKGKALTSLMPVGEAFMDLAEDAMPAVSEFFERAQPLFVEFAATFKDQLGPAMALINDAITRIGKALGITSDDVTIMDVALGALEIALNLVITAMQAVALIAQGLAWAVEQITHALKVSSGWIDSWKEKWDSVGDKIPDWLIPGSPTPFELGIRGITSAIRDFDNQQVGLNFSSNMAVASPSAAMGGNVYNITIDGVTASGEGGLEEAFASVLDRLRDMISND